MIPKKILGTLTMIASITSIAYLSLLFKAEPHYTGAGVSIEKPTSIH